MGGAWIIGIVVMLVSMLVSQQLRSRFERYSRTPLRNGLTGRQIAERMLSEHGLREVKVVSVRGALTDHYNPATRTVNLSEAVYAHANAAAAAVAAHECGHAVQHATAYSMLTLRSKLVPITQLSTTLSQWVIIAGIGIYGFGGGNQTVLLIGILLFAVSTLFAVVTLPVEFDASARALKWLDTSRITRGSEHDKAKDALKWAALTYVVSALASIAMLVQYILIYQSRDRE